MMTIVKRVSPGPIAVVVLLSAAVFEGRAAADDTAGLYVGGNLGRTLSTYSRSALDETLVSADNGEGYTLTVDAAFVHHQQAVWSADIGYMVSPYFGVETSYLDLARLRYFAHGSEVYAAAPYLGSSPLAANLDIASRGPTLALIGALPMTNDWSVNARVGAYEGKSTSDYRFMAGSNVSEGSESDSSTSLLAGAGTTYVLGAHWVLRLDYLYLDQIKEKVFGKSFNVSLVTAGVAYAF